MEDSTLKWFANRISHGGLVSKKQFNELVDQAHQKITNEFISARIEENESMLEYAKTHGDTRMVLVLTDRINNLKLERNTNITNAASVCPQCGCNKVQKLAGDNFSCMNAYCDWQTVLVENSAEDQYAMKLKSYKLQKIKNKKALSDAMHEAHKNRK